MPKLSIKILGFGCTNCQALEDNTRRAVSELGIPARIDSLTEVPAIMAYGVMRTPGLVVDEQVVVAGRVPSAEEIKWLLSTR